MLQTHKVSGCEHSQEFARRPNPGSVVSAGGIHRVAGLAVAILTRDFAPTCGVPAYMESVGAFGAQSDSSETSAASWQSPRPSDLRKGLFPTTPWSHAPQRFQTILLDVL